MSEALHRPRNLQPAMRPENHANCRLTNIGASNRHFSPATRGLGWHLLRLWSLSRAVALSVFRGLTRRAPVRAKAGEWYQVWARRAEWQDGFAPVAQLGGQPPRPPGI
jgi:hypothetical protein